MRDAKFQWSAEVNNCVQELESLSADLDALGPELSDLIRNVRELHTVSFNGDVEEYEIRHKAQQLWDAVSSGAREIRMRINDVQRSIDDTRRLADFYQ